MRSAKSRPRYGPGYARSSGGAAGLAGCSAFGHEPKASSSPRRMVTGDAFARDSPCSRGEAPHDGHHASVGSTLLEGWPHPVTPAVKGGTVATPFYLPAGTRNVGISRTWPPRDRQQPPLGRLRCPPRQTRRPPEHPRRLHRHRGSRLDRHARETRLRVGSVRRWCLFRTNIRQASKNGTNF